MSGKRFSKRGRNINDSGMMTKLPSSFVHVVENVRGKNKIKKKNIIKQLLKSDWLSCVQSFL